MTIDDFVRAEAAKPFQWGKTDCASTADRWVCHTAGVSPLSVFGRQYRTEDEAREWLAEPGSIAVAVNRVMRRAGFKKTDQPKAGDVGLVLHGDRLCMAVHAGDVWFTRDADGLIGAPLNAVWKAWRIAPGE